MNEKLLHTPEGVRDIYNSEFKKKLKVIEKIHHTLKLYSYQDIETPSFEFFDIFNIDKGSAPSNEMYKFFDRENNTLVLRPDITPSIARCAAKYYSTNELPIKLCYKGNTFTNAHQHQGKLNEATQIGCELINDNSSSSDAEIIACVINCLIEAGLDKFQIEIGQVEYFKGIIKEAGIFEQEENNIREFIQAKNFFGLNEYLNHLNISDKYKKIISGFDGLFGGLDMLDKAIEMVNNERSIKAINRIKEVYKALKYYGYEEYISFDLSMLNRYNYYTGIVFRGYTYGTGDAIVKGGRYDNLVGLFGKESPSVGFAIFVDELMMAISRQKIDIQIETSDALVVYSSEYEKEGIMLAAKLRKNNKQTELIEKDLDLTLDYYEKYGKNEKFSSMYYIESHEDILVISLINNEREKIKFANL